MKRVSWLNGLVCSTLLISSIGCEEKTHVVGALADGSAGREDASAGGEEGGGTGIPAECSNLPPCMLRLRAGCPPSGTCVRQEVDLSSYACYSNGVEIATVAQSLDVTSMTVTASRNGSTCWVLRTHRADAAPTLISVFEDGSGIQVATSSNGAITCTEDGSTTAIDPTCEISTVMYGDTSSCVPGKCPP